MGQMLLTVGGAFAGSLIGGPFGAQIGAMVGGAIGGALFGPTIEGPRLEDLTVSTSTYGNAIPRLFGTARMSTNMIWTSGIKETKKKSGGVGKGGPKTTTYSYSASFAVAVCAGEVDGLLRIWGDTKLLYGAGDGSGKPTQVTPGAVLQALVSGKTKKKYKFRVYTGSEEQLPDSVIVAKEGVGNVPAYRGLCYLVFENMPLEDFGNRIPSISVEVTKSATSSLPFYSYTDENNPGSQEVYPGGFYDWETDRYIFFGDNVRVYSIRTMKLLAVYPKPEGVSISKVAGSVGGGPWVSQIGTGNKRQVALLDGNTFQITDILGTSGTSLGESAINECVGPPRVSAGFVANGRMATIRVQSAAGMRYFFINLNGFGGGSVWGFDGTFVDYVTPANYMSLGEFDGYSEFLIWYQNGNALSFSVYRVYAGVGNRVDKVPVSTSECSGGFKWTLEVTGPKMERRDMVYNNPSRQIQDSAQVFYDPSDNSILITARDTTSKVFMSKFLVDTGEIKNAFDLPSNEAPFGMENARLNGGMFGFFSNYLRSGGSGVVTIDTNSGKADEAQFNVFNSYAGGMFDAVSQSVWVNYLDNGFHYRRFFKQVVAGKITVGSIASEIIEDTLLLGVGDYDTALLTKEVTGYVIGRKTTARDCLVQLSTAFLFDGVESDYKLKLVPRGGASIVSITEAQMGNVQDRDQQLKETLAQEVEAPMRLTVSYMDRSRDYQTGTQFAKRKSNPFPTMNSRKEDQIEFPIVMTADDAKQSADKLLKMAWANRVSTEMILPWRFLKYDPTDLATISLDDGSSRLVRLTSVDVGADFTLKIGGVNESAVAYVSTALGDPGRGVPSKAAFDPPTPQFALMNTPLLRDLDDTQGVGSLTYYSAYVPSAGFGGAYISKAVTGSDFEDVGYIAAAPTTGNTISTLPPTRAWAGVDRKTVIRVQMHEETDTLSGISYDELMDGKNLALVGKEVIQFQNAEQVGTNIWELSNILRARRGTDFAVNAHGPGELFMLLSDDGSIQYDTRADISFGYQINYKAVAPGTYADDVIGTAFQLAPNDLRPLSPSGYKVVTDGTNVVITFQRRSRISFNLEGASGDAPYREGQVGEGRFIWSLWSGTDASDKPYSNPVGAIPWKDSVAATALGEMPVSLDSGATYPQPTVTIPLIETGDSFTFSAYQKGIVEGFPSFVHAQLSEDGSWDLTELSY